MLYDKAVVKIIFEQESWYSASLRIRGYWPIADNYSWHQVDWCRSNYCRRISVLFNTDWKLRQWKLFNGWPM